MRSNLKRLEVPIVKTLKKIKDFKNKKNAVSTENDNIDEFIIPPGFFEIPKKSLFLELPYCPENEILAKHIIKKIHEFTNNEFKIIVKWITKKVRNLFNLKDKNPYPACQIYKGTCSCDQTYVGETRRNVAVRWSEHENPSKDSEPAKHLKQYPNHKFKWQILFKRSKT